MKTAESNFILSAAFLTLRKNQPSVDIWDLTLIKPRFNVIINDKYISSGKYKGKTMINFVLCDDNVQYLEMLKSLVDKECKGILSESDDYSVGPAFSSGEKLMDYLIDHRVDVLFLDIDMPELNGFEIAKIVCKDYKDTKIIFMSAYDNFVYSAFEFYPFAYLRKSHISEELPKVLKRVIEKIHEPDRTMLLSTVSGPKRIDISSITYVESDRNYYIVHVSRGDQYTCRGTLSSFEKSVEKYDFFRIHSAFLINLEYVDKMLGNGFVSVDKVSLPIAQRRMQEFKKTYMDYIRRSFGV